MTGRSMIGRSITITGFIIITVIAVFVLATGVFAKGHDQGDESVVTSPDGRIKVRFILDKGVPHYSVSYGDTVLIRPSSLGFHFKEKKPLDDNFKIIDVRRNVFYNTWRPVWGQTSKITNYYNELVIYLKEEVPPYRKMNLVFRVYNDGVGFRYIIPGQESLETINIMSEDTEFRLSSNNTTWWIHNDWDSYEYQYLETPLNHVMSASTPVTMKTPGGIYLSIHEAALVDYAGMALKRDLDRDYTLVSELCPWPDGVKVKGRTPLKTPWRTIQIGAAPGDLLESNLILNLNDPCALEDTSWIQPMKYVGIWWEMHIGKSTWEAGPRHGATTERAKYYIDFAGKHGIGGVLVEGWNLGWGGTWDDQDYTTPYPDFDLVEVAKYAEERGVEYIAHNETGGNVINYINQIEEAYSLYNSLGIHAIKTGYVADNGMIKPRGQHHHGQWMVNHYLDVIKKAAEYEIMIDAHEPIKPTGLYRTYPNFITREGVQGMEYNAWSAGNKPEHTTIIPFTRMLAGPIDYTPGIFDITFDEYRFLNRVHTTRAKQLALYVVIFSPLQMVADLPENYLDDNGNPLPEFKFIQDVPVTWDETLVLNARIGDYVTIARRRGQEWYVGSITDEKPRRLMVPLAFLEDGTKICS